jgi:uridine phosphorylase
LDALANIDFQTRCIKKKLTQLNLIRIGTSGALQEAIALDSFVMSTFALATDGLLQTHQNTSLSKSKIAKYFITHTKWPKERAEPMVVAGDKTLRALLNRPEVAQGITVTANSFYGPQARVLRLPLACEILHEKLAYFSYKHLKVTNLEMETAGIYGLSKLLEHRACSMNAILANRKLRIFSENPQKTIEKMIA